MKAIEQESRYLKELGQEEHSKCCGRLGSCPLQSLLQSLAPVCMLPSLGRGPQIISGGSRCGGYPGSPGCTLSAVYESLKEKSARDNCSWEEQLRKAVRGTAAAPPLKKAAARDPGQGIQGVPSGYSLLTLMLWTSGLQYRKKMDFSCVKAYSPSNLL